MQWIKFSKHNLPPQGLKIICFKQGDLWVARRFAYKGKSIYVEIPYGGKNGSFRTDTPQYWMRLDLPEGYSGYMKIGIEGSEPMTFDELQDKHPQDHEEFITMLLTSMKSPMPGH